MHILQPTMCRTREAQAALDSRNGRYKTIAARVAQRNKKEGVDVETRELSDRLGAAEKAVEKFVANRIQPAVQKVIFNSTLALIKSLLIAVATSGIWLNSVGHQRCHGASKIIDYALHSLVSPPARARPQCRSCLVCPPPQPLLFRPPISCPHNLLFGAHQFASGRYSNDLGGGCRR